MGVVCVLHETAIVVNDSVRKRETGDAVNDNVVSWVALALLSPVPDGKKSREQHKNTRTGTRGACG